MIKKSTTRMVIFVVILIIGVVGYYSYLSGRKIDLQKDDVQYTPVEAVIVRNLETDYPATPKEVVKFYNEIIKVLYNEEYTEDELYEMVEKSRMLLDSNLLQENDIETHVAGLESEVIAFRDLKRRITNFNVANSINVDYETMDGDSFARLKSTLFVLQGKRSGKVAQIFLLRKDTNGYWKIYGWDLEENMNRELE